MKKGKVFLIVALIALVSFGASWKVRSYLEDTVHHSGNVGQMMLAVRNDILAALAGTDGDYAPFQVNAAGGLYVAEAGNALASKTVLVGSFAGVAVADNGFVEIVADPGDNLAVHIVALTYTQTVQGLVTLYDETGGTPVEVSKGWYRPAYGGVILVPSPKAYFVATQESENFGLKNETGAACDFAGTVMYYVEALP